MVKSAPHRRGARAVRTAALLALTAVVCVSAQAQVPPIGPPAHDNTNPGNVKARAYQFGIGFPGAFIKVNWSRPSRVPASSILGYVINRLDPFSGATVVGGIAGDTMRGMIDSESPRTTTAYDGVPGDVAGAPATFDVVGIQPGNVYSYQVSAAYVNGLQDRDQDGEPDDEQYMSPLSSRSGFITAIGPPTIVAIDGQTPGGQPVQADNISVDWQQTPGADTYEIWISRDPNFKKKLKIKVPKVVPVQFGGPPVVSQTINANSKKLRGAPRIFITVGARNSQDPKPEPFGAIFSGAVGVEPLFPPPDPPGGGGGGGGGGDGPPPPPETAKKKKNR